MLKILYMTLRSQYARYDIVFMFIVSENRMAVQLKRKYNLRYHMKLFCIARRKEEI